MRPIGMRNQSASSPLSGSPRAIVRGEKWAAVSDRLP
jgi:hypothetical protein